MPDAPSLLADYARTGSEAAFRELVDRYLRLVYSTALRRVDGDSHRAQDVTQTVFADLARHARALPRSVMLGGWLHRRACHVAATLMRSERRRQARERLAAEMNALQNEPPDFAAVAPFLDEAINRLGDRDRTAILLRFFEERDFRSISESLGGTEDAARMRVSRALDKLHAHLKRRGLVLPAAALATVLAGNVLTAAPAGLVVTVSTAAIATAASGGTTLGILKLMMLSKLNLTAATVLALGIGTLVFEHHAAARLREENQSLRKQITQQNGLAAENERLAAAITAAAQDHGAILDKNQLSELLRLRGEVSRLRSESQAVARNETAQTLAPAERLRHELDQMPERNIPELQLLEDRTWVEDAGRAKLETEDGVRQALGNIRRAAKLRFVSRLGLALRSYLDANQGILPRDLSELKPYFSKPIDDAILQRYALVHSGSTAGLPADEPLVAEKAPVDDRYDTLFKIGADTVVMEGVGNWVETMTNRWNFTGGRR